MTGTPAARATAREDQLALTARHLWQYRLELTLLLLVAGGWLVLTSALGTIGAVLLAAAIAGIVATPRARHTLLRRLHDARARRRFTRAYRALNPHGPLAPVARITRITDVPAGVTLNVILPRGRTPDDLDPARLASHLGARAVQVTARAERADLATVLIQTRDPFANREPIPWPLLNTPSTSVWNPVPMGVDQYGNTIRMPLIEKNLLLAGLPGGGKSLACSLVAAHAALDADCKLWLLDGKRVELAAWAPVAERTVGPDMADAIDVLEHLQTVMDQRYQDLLARGARKIDRTPELPAHVLICDELAFYLEAGDKQERAAFQNVLTDLVRRGRAAGVIAVCATQKPGSDTVPTALRDLFGYRLALRCTTPQASDTVLGQGTATRGYDASTIPNEQRGVGYLKSEASDPTLIKGFYLGDQDLSEIAARAAALRFDREHANALEAEPVAKPTGRGVASPPTHRLVSEDAPPG